MKQIYLFLVITLVVLLPSNAFAQMAVGTRFTVDGITYQVVTNTNTTKTAQIVACSLSGDIVFHSQVESITPEKYLWTVKNAQSITYTNSSAVTSLTYEEGITAISNATFPNLHTINIPSTVEKIQTSTSTGTFPNLLSVNISEDNPYFCCENLVLYNKEKTSLIYYYHPTTKTETTFTVPDGVEHIAVNAFIGTHLVDITYPASVANIEAKNYGTKIENIYVNASNNTYCDVDGVLYSKDMKVLYTCPQKHNIAGGTYEVPEGVETVKHNAFYANQNLKAISFPNSINNIEESAFLSCSALTYVKLPDNAEIQAKAFYQCNGISTIDIGKRNSFSADMFYYCEKISDVIVDEDNETYKGIDGIVFTKDEKTLVFCPRAYGNTHPKEYSIPEGTITIGAHAFWNGCKLDKITVASSVKYAEEYCFYGTNEVEFTEESCLEVIGDYTFQCYRGNTIDMPGSVKEIGSYAFANSSLTSITLNEGLVKMKSGIFYSTKIEELRIPSTVNSIGTIGGNNPKLKKIIFSAGSELSYLSNIFANLTALEEVIFEEGSQLTTINGSFANLPNLKSIVLPETATSLYAKSFFQCENLESVTFREPCQLTSIGANTFQSCGLKSFDVPSSVKTISDAAFYDCNKLETIHLPAATQTCSNTAFMLCTGLKEINVDKENQYLASSDGILLDKKKEELKIFPAGKANEHFTLLPPSIKKIGDYSFYFNKSLKNVCIPNKVTSIGVRAFAECPNLETMTFLCDEMIDPANIKIGDSNTASFALTPLENITIYVRKDLLSQYEDTDFYKQFKQIKPSFLNTAETEEYIPVDASTVDLLDVRSHDFSYIVPNSVTHEGKTYDVKLIGDYAFQNASSDIKEVITFENVEYIGAKAFKQTTGQSIKNIIFVQKEPSKQLLSTYRFELTPADLPNSDAQYLEVDNSVQHVYVRRSDADMCRSQWPYYQDVITHEIPTTGEFNIIPTAENGTFAREFAVDLSNGGTNTVNEGKQGLLAFVPGERFKISDTEYNIRMYSINEGGEGDGTYIPAGTGVLLRKYSDNMPAYYEIAENQSSATNAMTQSVVINSGTIPASTETRYNFYIGKSDGLAHKATKTTNIGVHRAYLSIPIDSDNTGAAKKVTFSFTDPDSTTDINEVMPAAADNDQWFNINGQRVISPSKGLYIRNGKKVAVK